MAYAFWSFMHIKFAFWFSFYIGLCFYKSNIDKNMIRVIQIANECNCHRYMIPIYISISTLTGFTSLSMRCFRNRENTLRHNQTVKHVLMSHKKCELQTIILNFHISFDIIILLTCICTWYKRHS